MLRLKLTPKAVELHLKQLAENPVAIGTIVEGLSADDLCWSLVKKISQRLKFWHM